MYFVRLPITTCRGRGGIQSLTSSRGTFRRPFPSCFRGL